MSLTKYLREQHYDLIEGPVRNHKPLQLWLKKGFNGVELYYSDIIHAFVSDIKLTEIEASALSVSSSRKDEYSFNIGITLLEEILKSLGIGNFEISTKIKYGKSVTISYDNSITKEVPVGEIGTFLSSADFKHPNPDLLRNANRNNILIITGILFAKNLVVEIETNLDLDTNLIASLNQAADGKLDFSINTQQKLKMISSGNSFFPIAVKASRIDFDKGLYQRISLVTDTRNFF